jgi:hypothetical protein
LQLVNLKAAMFVSRSSRKRSCGVWFPLLILVVLALFLDVPISVAETGDEAALIPWYNPEAAKKVEAGQRPGGVTDITLLSSSIFPGDFYDLVYHNGYLYLANGWQSYSGNLQVYDTFDPDSLYLVGQYTLEVEGGGFRLAFKDNCAYMAVYGYGLVILDVTDPGAITLISQLETEEPLNDLHVEGDYLYLALDSYGLKILDVSSPGNPQPVGHYETSNPSRSIAVWGDYAYMADGSAGITALDISDPADPRWVYNYTDGDKEFEEIITDSELAVVGFRREMINTGGFIIVEISNPPHYRILSEQTIFGVQGFPDMGVALVDSLLFVAGVQAGFQVYNLRDPSDPERLGGFGGGAPTGANYAPWPARVTLGEHFAYTICPDRYYAVTANDIEVVNISDLTDPHIDHSWDTPCFVMNSRVEGDYAYVAASSEGIIIENISDPLQPQFVSRFNIYNDHFIPARALDLEGEVAFVTGGRHSLTCVDISDPEQPQGLSDYDVAEGYGADLEVEGDLCAIAHYEVFPEDGWVTILDVTDPLSPGYVATYDTYCLTLGVDIEAEYLYIAERGGIEIVDISNPHHPSRVSLVETGIGCYDVEVIGDYAYAVDESTGLNIIDVRDPLNPEIIGTMETPAVSKGISVRGDLAVIADYDGLVIAEVSDPQHPELLEAYDTKGFALGITSAPGYAYLADFFAFDIFLVEFTSVKDDRSGELPSDFTLLEPYPNPFNASVVIPYYLPRRASVSVEIYNLLGERVVTLSNPSQPAGYGSVAWNPGRETSGVYFCRFKAGGGEAVKRLILLK